MVEQVEQLKTYGLDTLSEYALRRRLERWTGSLEHPDSVAARYPVGEQAASDATLGEIAEQWQSQREPFTVGDVADVLGGESSLAYNVNLLEASGADSVVMTAESTGAELQSGTMSLAEVAAEQVAEGEVLSSIPVDVADALRYATEAGVLQDGAVAVSGYWDVISSVGLNLFVVAVIFGYLFCVYRYFDDMAALFYSVFRRNVILSAKVGERRRSEIFYGFLGKIFLLGLAFVALLSLVWVSTGRGQGAGIEQGLALYAAPISVGIFLLVIIAQSVILTTVGVVTQSLSMVTALFRIRLVYFVLGVVLAAPIFLTAMIGSGESSQMWMNLGLVTGAATLLLYARESIELFISKKVSILHWILYLCAVEILPFTLVWQIATRLR
jgi:hypothetical protein